MARAATKSRASRPASLRRRLQNSCGSNATVLATNQNKKSVQTAHTRESAIDHYRKLKRKAEELGFVVQHSKFCSERPVNVPIEHQARFEHIQALGRLKYDSYGLQPSPESIDKPWQLKNKSKANLLSELAIKCKKERQNEAGWRAIVEFRLFDRFDIEVTCKFCRRRMWRSEIEADQDAGNSRTNSLKRRQARRDGPPCECGPEWRMDNIHDPGLSPIFSSRIQEPNFLQDHETNANSVKKEPDRIHGLQSTTSLEKLLQQQYEAQSQQDSEPSRRLADVLQVSCNPDCGGQRLFFPFLVMEAKSAKGGSNFDEIEVQTAHPIINLLSLQHQLQIAEFNNMKMPGGPLAWFLANVGEIWRVYGCYATSSGDRSRTSWVSYAYVLSELLLTLLSNIVLIWEGSITGLDETLQLILIIDYILDWARDTYRPSILRQLKCIAAGDTKSDYTVTHDSDILSMVHPIGEWLGGQSQQTSLPTIDAAASTITRSNLTVNSLLKLKFKRLKLMESRIHEVMVEYPKLGADSQGVQRMKQKLEAAMQESRIMRQEYELKLPILNRHCGRVRYGTILESRVRGVCITADNLGTMLQGLGDRISREAFASEIDKVVKTRRRCFVLDDARALCTMEQIWTGDSIYSTSPSHSTLVSVQVRFWVTKEWELVRELNYLTITEEAYNVLIKSRKRKELKSSEAYKWGRISGERLVSFTRDLDNTFREDFLLRCLERQVLVLHHTPCIAFRPDARLKGTRGPVSELVSTIYNKHRIGLRKPDEEFIRDIATIENISPTPQHPFWSAYQNGILVSGRMCGLCLYVANKNVAFDRLAENLASRFSLDREIFNACLTSSGGSLLGGSLREKNWNTQCRIETACGALQDLASWIIREKPAKNDLLEIQNAFQDMTMFARLMEFRDNYREGEFCENFDFTRP